MTELHYFASILDAGRFVAQRTPLEPDPAVDVPVIWPARSGPNGGMRWVVATLPQMGQAIARVSRD